MKDKEQNLISGSLHLNTPEGPIDLDFTVNIAAGAGIIPRYMQRLFSPPIAELVQEASEPAVVSERRARSRYDEGQQSYLEERRGWDPIFALIPPEEVKKPMTIRAVNLLRRGEVTSVASLASLTDDDLSDVRRFRYKGPKTSDYICHLRELAQRQLEQTKQH